LVLREYDQIPLSYLFISMQQPSKSPFIVTASGAASAAAASVHPLVRSHAILASRPVYQTVTLKAKPAPRNPHNLHPMDTAVLDQMKVDEAEAKMAYVRVQPPPPPIVQLQTMNASHVIVEMGGHTSSAGSWIQHLHTHAVQQSECITKLKTANLALNDVIVAMQRESKQREADNQQSVNELKSMIMQLDARLKATATKLSATLYSADRFTVDVDAKTEPAGLLDEIRTDGNTLNRVPTDLIASGRENTIPSPSAGMSDVSRQLLLSHSASQGQLSNSFVQFLSAPPPSPMY